jgi:sigma-B regulation protein RsbU (phosphoserine phosphatase)
MTEVIMSYKRLEIKHPIIGKIVKTILWLMIYGAMNHLLFSFSVYQGAGFSIRIQIIIPFLVGYFLGPISGFIVGFGGNMIGDYFTGTIMSNLLTYSVANGLYGLLMGLFPERKKIIDKPQKIALLYIYLFGINIIAMIYVLIIDETILHTNIHTQIIEMIIPIIISNVIVCSMIIPIILYFKKCIKKLMVIKLLLALYYFSYVLAIGSVLLILIFVGIYFDFSSIAMDPSLFLFNMLVIPIVMINTIGFRFSYYLTKKIITPLTFLKNGIEKSSNNKFTQKIKINANPEIQVIAESFNKMIDQLQLYTAEIETTAREKEKLTTELNVASRIQQSILPHNDQEVSQEAGIDIYGEMIPAKEVGGDFYNYFFVDQDHLCFIVADVSGKGIPAGLFMMITSTLLESRINDTIDIEKAMNSVNNQLCERNSEGYFVTVFIGILNIKTKQFKYVNAGHNPPLIKRKENPFKELECNVNFVLGGMEDIDYGAESTYLEKGDQLFIFTDGVTEATNREFKLYSLDLLLQQLNGDDQEESSMMIVKRIFKSIDDFVIGAEQSDDITILSLKI